MPPDELARHIALEDLEAERQAQQETHQRTLARLRNRGRR